MKLPSLFKQPKHRQFNYKPRYYDPVKEDIENRIKAHRSGNSPTGPDAGLAHKVNISRAFQRQERKGVGVSLVQLFFVLLFVGVFVLYYYYGNLAFYLFLAVAPVYLLYRRGIIKL